MELPASHTLSYKFEPYLSVYLIFSQIISIVIPTKCKVSLFLFNPSVILLSTTTIKTLIHEDSDSSGNLAVPVIRALSKVSGHSFSLPLKKITELSVFLIAVKEYINNLGVED